MKFISLVITDIILIGALFLLSPWYYQLSPLNSSVHKAVAVVHGLGDSNVTGKVTFMQEKDGVRVIANIKGLTPGKHGFHIHAFGDCGCPDGMCTGDHYNPTNEPHGGPASTHRHVGDFGNLDANEQGEAHLDFVDTHCELNGRNSIIGRSIIIHEKEDDLTSQPSGNAGGRIACGSIGIVKP
ncbi:MAG TPA: superoxide dismutase family protein [Candidatus Babeliales bacterium]|nr:superoxide dismutase family protein [Candidatus Babeliales bacterium]